MTLTIAAIDRKLKLRILIKTKVNMIMIFIIVLFIMIKSQHSTRRVSSTILIHVAYTGNEAVPSPRLSAC